MKTNNILSMGFTNGLLFRDSSLLQPSLVPGAFVEVRGMTSMVLQINVTCFVLEIQHRTVEDFGQMQSTELVRIITIIVNIYIIAYQKSP